MRFLREAGITELDALLHFNLAPLSVRRDIAMLGIIHRCVLGDGPPQFSKYFELDTGYDSGYSTRLAEGKHSKHLKKLRTTSSSEVMKRSILGLIAIYNMLPEEVVMCSETSDFQTALQDLVKIRAVAGCDDWKLTLSPRVPLRFHPLR